MLSLANTASASGFFNTSCHQVFIHMDKFPSSLLFSRLNNPSSQPLLGQWIIFMALCWTHFHMPMSPLSWEPSTGHCVSPGLSRGERSPPLTCRRCSALCTEEDVSAHRTTCRPSWQRLVTNAFTQEYPSSELW